MKHTFASVVLVASTSILAASVLVIPGCSSSSQQAVKRSEKTVDSIGDFRKQLVAANAQLEKTMTSLDAVINGTGDSKSAFLAYSKNVADLQKQGEDAKSRSDSLQARGREYIEKWQKDVSTVTNPDLKAQADARRAHVQERIDEVQANAKAAGDAYRPLMKNLTDIQTVLANDLTAANISGVAPVAAEARKSSAALTSSINDFISELDKIQAGIGPGTAR